LNRIRGGFCHLTTTHLGVVSLFEQHYRRQMAATVKTPSVILIQLSLVIEPIG
jgi:hypothetical protein